MLAEVWLFSPQILLVALCSLTQDISPVGTICDTSPQCPDWSSTVVNIQCNSLRASRRPCTNLYVVQYYSWMGGGLVCRSGTSGLPPWSGPAFHLQENLSFLFVVRPLAKWVLRHKMTMLILMMTRSNGEPGLLGSGVALHWSCAAGRWQRCKSINSRFHFESIDANQHLHFIQLIALYSEGRISIQFPLREI